MTTPDLHLREDTRPLQRAGLGMLFVLAVAAALLVTSLQGEFFGAEIALAIVVGFLTLAPMFVRWYQGRFDLFEPVTLVSFIYFVYFSFAPILRLLTYDLVLWERSFETGYIRAFGAVIVATIFMWAGYMLPLGRRLGTRCMPPLHLSDVGVRVLRRWGWALTVGAIAGLVLWTKISGNSLTRFFLPGIVVTQQEGAGDGTDVGYLFSMIEWFVSGFLLLWVSRGFRNRPLQLLHWLLLVIVFVSSAFRFRLFIFLVASLMLFYLRRRARPGVPMLLGSGAVLLFAAGWVSLMRVYFFSYGTVGTASPTIAMILKSALKDTWIFVTLAAVMEAIPRYINYVYADPLVYILILPVPRFLWPDKPSPEWLGLIGQAIGTRSSGIAGAAVPHFGEFYMAFGWAGIAVSMLLFGIYIRALWAFYQADPDDPGRQVIFAIHNIWLFQVIIRGYIPQTVKEFCLFVLPAILALTFARRQERRALRLSNG